MVKLFYLFVFVRIMPAILYAQAYYQLVMGYDWCNTVYLFYICPCLSQSCSHLCYYTRSQDSSSMLGFTGHWTKTSVLVASSHNHTDVPEGWPLVPTCTLWNWKNGISANLYPLNPLTNYLGTVRGYSTWVLCLGSARASVLTLYLLSWSNKFACSSL